MLLDFNFFYICSSDFYKIIDKGFLPSTIGCYSANDPPARLPYFRYEFTVTYNPKWIESVDYAESLTDYVIDDIRRFLRRNCDSNSNLYNYVVEYQKNGMPHIHGTIFNEHRFKSQTLENLEKSLQRKYGKTMIYSTGHIDKIHKNDHFNGSWQEYLSKEATPIFHINDRLD